MKISNSVNWTLPQIGSVGIDPFFVLQNDLFNDQDKKESKTNDESSHRVIDFGIVLLFDLVQDVIHSFVYVWEEIQNASCHKYAPGETGRKADNHSPSWAQSGASDQFEWYHGENHCGAKHTN